MTGPALQYAFDEEALARRAVRRARLGMAATAARRALGWQLLFILAAVTVLLPALFGAMA